MTKQTDGIRQMGHPTISWWDYVKNERVQQNRVFKSPTYCVFLGFTVTGISNKCKVLDFRLKKQAVDRPVSLSLTLQLTCTQLLAVTRTTFYLTTTTKHGLEAITV